MKVKAMRRMVAHGDYLDDEESLRAYSYDASGVEQIPLVIVRPRHVEHVRRILVHANQYRIPIVPRGSGTGLRGGAVRKDAVIMDLRGFDTIDKLDTQLNTVDVGAGVTFKALKEWLATHKYSFPLEPSNQMATIGGLAAQNVITEESMLFGDWTEMVARIECFDGLGRFQVLKGKDVAKVLGWEGSTGVITKLRLNVIKTHKRTADVIHVNNPSEALAHAERASQIQGTLMIEYLDEFSSKLMGLSADQHVFIVYANDAGSYKDPLKVNELVQARKRLTHALWNEGYLFEGEASLEEEQIERFVARCEAAHVPCYGHLGVGIMLAGLKSAAELEKFRVNVVALGATPGGKYGYGRVKKEYVPQALRKEAIKLKDQRDYNMILNPGVYV